tara:strand:- start:308 stop:538 length:231 start_codon:yes stop_codon:yes gene_type:complete
MSIYSLIKRSFRDTHPLSSVSTVPTGQIIIDPFIGRTTGTPFIGDLPVTGSVVRRPLGRLCTNIDEFERILDKRVK